MKTLFIGNGLNYLGNNNYSWENLITDLIRTAGKEDLIDLQNVPFPILYEEIFLRGLKYNGVKEDKLIDKVISKMKDMIPNDSHKLLEKANVENIITTNYDYNIENSLIKNFVLFEIVTSC